MSVRCADADEIRTIFCRAMSDMYRAEVPQYGTLMELVNDNNRDALQTFRWHNRQPGGLQETPWCSSAGHRLIKSSSTRARESS